MEIVKPKAYFFLNEEQLVELERLAALGYTNEQLAMYFQIERNLWIQAASDPGSTVSYRVERGKLVSLAKEQLFILEAAEGGNISASQQLANIKRTRGFKISREQIFSGFDDMKTYRLFDDWIQGGCKTKLSAEEDAYLEALTVINSLDRKYGRRNTIEYLAQRGVKRKRAAEMYDEAICLFNTDRNIDKKSFRNKYADLLDDAALLIRDNISTSKDAEVYGNLLTQAGKFRQLDQKDPEPLPAELFQKSVRYFSLDATSVGLPAISRTKVAKQIDELEIPETDKHRVRMDAMLIPLNIEETIDELEEESRSR